MSETAITEAPRSKRPPVKLDREPATGMPVQFCNGTDGIIPGVLQRRNLTDPSLWDVKISLSGAGVWVTRAACRFSAEPKAGCWSWIPGL